MRSVLFLAKGISVCGEGVAMAGPLSQMPMNIHPAPKADNTVAEQFIEQIDGETTFDQVHP